MALARRRNGGANSNGQTLIWPGFVDGLATLLMVIIFVLMVFFLVQLSLAHRIFGQDASIQQLRGEITELGTLLNLERAAVADLTLERQALQNELAEGEREIAQLQDQLANTENQLAQSQSQRQALETQLSEATTQQQETSEELAASQREILQLTASTLALQDKLKELQALLDEKTEEARAANEISVSLTRQLNDALSSKVVELTRFRSEFFGRLREVLQNRDDINIVGDRFVFQSEVLFALGSAEINPDGKQQLDTLISALIDISRQIPPDIDWILQIDGHTDNVPFATATYGNNWELSTARALSVLYYFVEQGIPPHRLAATGYGEFQPIDTRNTDSARAQNRRIEFKLSTP
ncbi:MAG: peptidoglycan -binding protein [Proteobacteria bacterium]|nr:peptidoglycan -binding protein [Pseudomonadota bacterium]